MTLMTLWLPMVPHARKSCCGREQLQDNWWGYDAGHRLSDGGFSKPDSPVSLV